ncbi:MAG: PTS sugar transporter subunit IIA [Candidatus Eisenbacteria bacterium]|nr:PTS sugar transporter subunit IIA [Candidatus Eisenbacteria bacterium]
MKIAQYLPEEAIIPTLTVSNKLEALRHMLRAMNALGYLSDPAQAEHDLLTREARMTTGIGHGIAVPHARTASVTALHAVLARHADGLDWAALDGRPVHFILLALSPSDAPGPHLQFVASMARLMHDGEVYASLLAAPTARRMHGIVSPPKRKGLFRP